MTMNFISDSKVNLLRNLIGKKVWWSLPGTGLMQA